MHLLSLPTRIDLLIHLHFDLAHSLGLLGAKAFPLLVPAPLVDLPLLEARQFRKARKSVFAPVGIQIELGGQRVQLVNGLPLATADDSRHFASLLVQDVAALSFSPILHRHDQIGLLGRRSRQSCRWAGFGFLGRWGRMPFVLLVVYVVGHQAFT